MKNIINNKRHFLIVSLIIAVGLGVFGFSGASFATDALDNYGLDDAAGFGLGSLGLVETIGNIVRIFLGFLGILAVLLIAYGGFLWMTAAGDVNKVVKAKKVIIAAVIGLVIIFSAFAIASFVINQISNATNPNPPGPGPEPPTPWDWSSQYSYIGGFKDDTIGDSGWAVNIGWNYTGTLGIPASDSLQAKGYAKNINSVISAMDFYDMPDGATNFSLVSAFDILADQEIVSNVYASWNTSAYNINDNPFAKIMVTVPEDDFQSNALSALIRPIHCFNGVQDSDQGETGVDCGGECGACPGDPCDADTDTPVCDADNSMCATGVCDIASGCVCAQVPEIIYISPADDPNGDTNYDEPSTWVDDIPNGAPGNYITIWGRYFGNQPGEVRFNDQIANLGLKDGCDDTWTYYQIIVEVPELPQGDYNVQVFNDYGLGSNTKTFSINNIERPGICSAYNLTEFDASGIKINSGKDGDEVVSIGNNYPLSDSAGDFFWYFSTKYFDDDTDSWVIDLIEHNNNNTVWNWDGEENLKDYVPTNRKGRSSVRVYNAGNNQYSNYYKFLVSPGELGDPCGYDTALCAMDTITCQPGLVCDGISCTCQLAPNICGDNLLGPEESCDIVGGSYDFYQDKALCSDYDLGEGQISCTGDCQLDTSNCEFSSELASPASQSIYTWSFITGDDDSPKAYAIEDCTRSRSCTEGAKLPSPTPWSEGWNTKNYPYYDIENPLACLDVVISARFNTQMDPATINSDNIKVLKCDDIEGDNCAEVSGNLSLASDNSDKENDYFRFISSADLEPNSWYKVVLREGITTATGQGFRMNESDRTKINKRFCNVSGVNGGSYDISNSVYCWNFQTRDNNSCQPGCVECSPDPHTMYWPLASTGYLADVDSDDNVCLLLDPQSYSWQWFTDKPAKLGVTSANQASTAIALGETIYDQPNPYASLFAKMTGFTDKQDYCRAYNDFTNPIVVEDVSCSNGNIQSPTPWKESQDACVNAMIAARFSRNMLDSSINASNIKVQKCNQGVNDEFDPTSCVDMAYSDLWIFDYNHEIPEAITQEYIETAANLSNDLAEGFVVIPSTTDNLDVNTWYRVIILGGDDGVRGAKLESSGEQAEGRLKKTNCNGDGDADFDDYCWKFKTSIEECDINSVNVAPRNLFMRYTDSKQVYNAFPQAGNCNLLNPYSYSWNWRSLIALSDDDQEVDDTGGSGINVASICQLDASQCSPGDYLSGLSDPIVKVFAQAEGAVNIKVRAQNTREIGCAWNDPNCGDKWNYGSLQIGFAGLRLIEYRPGDTQCSDAPIELAFNIDVDMETVKSNQNVLLYRVDDAGGLSPVALNTDVYPDFQYSSTVKILPASLLATGNYRAVVKGGPKQANGIIAWNGKQLENLNYNSSLVGVGEECESGLYPWSDTLGVCSATNCLLTGNLCDTQFTECNSRKIMAYYPFDFNANDNYGFYNGTVIGAPTLVNGIYGRGYNFDGVDDKIIQATIPDDLTSQNYTVSFWFSPDGWYNSAVTRQALIQKKNADDSSSLILGFSDEDSIYPAAPEKCRYNNSRNKLIFMFGANSEGDCAGYGNIIVGQRELELNTGRWYYVTATYNQANGEGKLYIDGQLQGTAINLVSNAANSDLAIGGAPAIATDWQNFDGKIDELRIYRQALSDSEIKELYSKKKVYDIYCTSLCHNMGNNNAGSCGNGIVESGEDCDDGNTVGNDGCSGICLWEGSNQRWGSLCLNGEVEYGEECDFGSEADNLANNCNLSCLFITDPDTGRRPGVPVCGNSIIEVGEDCDDGNTNVDDGCDDRCKNEGSDVCSGGNTVGCCGNNFVESTAPDSFSWEFSVDQSESICYPGATIDINPCPNAIWRVNFPQGIGDAKIVIQQGSNAATNPDPDNCVDANEPLSFWQLAIKKIKDTVKKAFGLTVSAANYWCTISEQNYNFSNFDNFSNSADGFEMIGYKNNFNSAVVNYLKDVNWAQGQEYRIVVDYDNYGLSRQVIEKSLTVFNAASGNLNANGNCALSGQIVNIWPIGEEKYQDNFFCDGDNCGQNDYDPYLKDQDAGQGGNNHLYRAWAYNDLIEPERKYLVKPYSGFVWDITAIIPTIRLNIENSDYSDTNYSGDQWLTLSKSDLDIYDASGWANLLVKAIESAANSDEKNINISVFLCGNPWPYPEFFPFVDSETNCTFGSLCLNTNFKTYYCRDSGNEEPFDDLPAIGNYDYLTDKLDIAVSGLNKNIIKDFFFNRSLPDKVKDDFGYWDGEIVSPERVSYVEGKVGQALKFNLVNYPGIDQVAVDSRKAVRVNQFWNLIDSDPITTDYQDAITISAWVKAGSGNDGCFFIDSQGLGGINDGFVCYDRISSVFRFSFLNSPASVFSVPVDDFDNWHFVAISSAGCGMESHFYFDDQIINYNTLIAACGSTFLGPESHFNIGYVHEGDGSQVFDGLIDELKIHQAALSKEEIDSSSGRNLVAYYSFDEPSNDAIGIRVAQNDEHYSPSLWYFGNFDRDRQGKPKVSIVDNYSAAKEGRTTYVNAADLNNNKIKIFTDVYLVSYNEGADGITQNIYSLMLKYLGFNYGTIGVADGGLMEVGECSNNPAIFCRTDRDCQLENFGYCNAPKARVTRDTQRLADVQDINLLLEIYKSVQRCSNDHSVLCSDSNQCYGDGICGGYYPVLKSGSYIVGRSFSVWPSWQATLGNFLGMALPVDPLNNLAGCAPPYDSVTCWDEISKSMQCPSGANVYSYYDKNQDTNPYAGLKTFNEYSNNWDNNLGVFEATLDLFGFIPGCP